MVDFHPAAKSLQIKARKCGNNFWREWVLSVLVVVMAAER